MRRNRFPFCCLMLAATAACATAHPAPEAVVLESGDAQAIDAWLARKVQASGLVGLSAAVAHDGKLVLAKGYGVKSLATRAPVDPDTRFALGSVTKQFTAACVLLLAEDGKLSVNDPVSKYFPELTRASDITLLDLLNHVSGYPDYYPLDFSDRRIQKPIAVDELIHQYATGPLDFEPGTRWSYSNTGYLILGRIVEKVSGETFGAFLEQRILKPVGMTSTRYEPDAAVPEMAEGHASFALAPWVSAPREAKGWVASAGALWSTAPDLVKWDLALASGQVLKPDSYRLYTTARRLASGAMKNYGCGVLLLTRGDDLVLTHEGSVSGFLASNTVIPSSKTAIVLLTNTEDSGTVEDLMMALLSQFLPKPGVPKVAGPSAVEVAKVLFKQLQAGSVDKSKLGEEFAFWLTDARLKAASQSLAPYGELLGAKVESLRERGGMEVSSLELSFKSGPLTVLMYRKPDGKVEEFFVSRK